MTRQEVIQRFKELDQSPSALCRWIIATQRGIGPGEVMGILIEAFGVELGDVSALGGWWPGVETELDDEAIDRLLGGPLRTTLGQRSRE